MARKKSLRKVEKIFVLLVAVFLCVTARAELVGRWYLDESSGTTAADSSGNSNTGVLYNMDTSSCWVSGISGMALEFDGVDDCVTTGNVNSLKITDQLTVEMWINPSVWGEAEHILNNNLYRIYHRGWGGDKRIYFLYRTQEQTPAGDSPWDYWSGVVSSTRLEPGQWYHVVGVKSGDTMTLYINGVKERELDCLSGYTPDDSLVHGVKIGDRPYNGKVDEVKIYSNAFNAKDVVALYKAIDLRGYWKLDDAGASSSASDSSKNSNTGILYNMDTSSCWVSGISGMALEFDGVDDCVTTGNVESLKITDQLTVEMWINPSVWGEAEHILNNNLYRIYHRGWGGDKRIYFLYRTQEQTPAGDSPWDYWSGVVSTTRLEPGQWYHVAGVKSGDTMTLYINGVKERELDCLDGYTPDDLLVHGVKIGDRPYNGKVDEVRIYANAFDENDISALYESVSLRGYWRMNGNANDFSKNGNTGTLHNMDTSTCWVDGILDSALSFDGTDDYLDCGNDNSLKITDQLTVEMWINPAVWNEGENILSNNLYRIYHRGWGGDKRIYFLYRIAENINVGDSNWYNWAGVVSTTRLEPGQWYHVVGVKSGDTMALYINGVKERELDCLSGYTVDSSLITNLQLGKYPYSGKIDEVRIYCFPLTSDKINQHYYMERYGYLDNPTGNPVGGGAGYIGIYTSGDYEVDTSAEFLSAIASATSGDVIYIEEDAQINLTGQSSLTIPEGVTVASNRGDNGSPGGLIYTDDLVTPTLTLFNMSDHSRFTGLRLRGPDQQRRVTARELPVAFGLRVTAPWENVTVDNCEIFGWAYAGVYIYGSDNDGDRVRVSHNHIHHCHRRGHGYGVSNISGAESLVEANIFNWCRHAVSGWSPYEESYYIDDYASGYEACYNLILPHTNGSIFDMHGGSDVDNLNIPAGDKIEIHHNTLLNIHERATGIRGIPSTGADVYDNWTVQAGSVQDIFTQWIDSPYDNMDVYNNYYGTSPFIDSKPAKISYPEFTPPQGVSDYMILNHSVYDHGFNVAVDGSNNIYVAGCYEYGFLTAKYNSSGNLLWKKVYQNGTSSRAYDITVDSSGNVYVSGTGYNGVYFLSVMKYNSGGTLVWNKKYGDTQSTDDLGYGVAVDVSGNVIATGYSGPGTGYHPSGKCVTVKYDSSGNSVTGWPKEYTSGYYNRGRDVAVDSSGNIYVVGMTQSSSTADYDVLLIKYLPNGTQSWVQTYDSGNGLSDWGYHLAIDDDGKIYICGQSYNEDNWDYLTLKYNANGTLAWARKFDNGGWEYGRGIDVDSDGNVYVTGFSDDLESKDFMTIKYNSSGTLCWTNPVTYDGGDIDQAYGIALDSNASSFYVTGYSVDGAVSNFMTVKYSNQ